MTEEIVSFELAKLAKQIDFNFITRAYYTPKSGKLVLGIDIMVVSGRITAPTQSLLQKWFREKKNLSIVIKHYDSGAYSFNISKHNGNSTGWTRLSKWMEASFYSYEEALEEALTEAFKHI